MDNYYRLNSRLITNLGDVLSKPVSEMINAVDMPSSTWYHIMKHPENISIQQLLQIANTFHIPVRRFFYQGATYFVEHDTDYVMPYYKPCYYDEAALQAYVNENRDTTWQGGANKVGLTRSRLRDSLLAIRRTPVQRFLDVCKEFGVDPFTILIDPNPEHNPKESPDTAILHQQINELSATVDNLLEDYRCLLERHNRLENTVRDYLGLDTRTLQAAESSTAGQGDDRDSDRDSDRD